MAEDIAKHLAQIDSPPSPTTSDPDSESPTRRRGRPASGKTTRDGNHVQSLTRALSLLVEIADSDGGASLSELAHRVGLPPSTAHRLLKSLEQQGFVQHDLQRALWHVGVQAFTVGNGFLRNRDVVEIARPHMRRLMEESGESVNLGILEAAELVYLAQVECREVMRVLARPGGRAPLHCSGMGKALLAALPDDQASRMLTGTASRKGLARFTDKTISTTEAMQRELAAIRQRGYSIDDEEYAAGLRCVAATVHDEHGEPMAAISLSGPSARMTDPRLRQLGDMVARAAQTITRAVGGRPTR
ncbi:MAG: helix-turn-helix domain-containing protein [Alphaproteobacteria bacterium]|nr:helix-turn-helix domain-containing protein [Alphaproteobacteria bacterium]MBU0798226.1 helix-turn-helix domain-containing protein [Alphaproteobacteria bacterium]MBU0888628.1 helix-turn-helix domain-containing protein [Alphaproteobacteria bacterium]MBU1813638.1 helix-turn-helix domain-containing protein [Alphaproteobacteria bacterium]